MMLRSTEKYLSNDHNTEPTLEDCSREAGGLAARAGMLLIAKSDESRTGRAIDISRIEAVHQQFNDAIKEVYRLDSIENGLRRYASELSAPQLAQLALTLFESHGQLNDNQEIRTSPEDLETLRSVAAQQTAEAEARATQYVARTEGLQRASGFRAAEASIEYQTIKLRAIYNTPVAQNSTELTTQANIAELQPIEVMAS